MKYLLLGIIAVIMIGCDCSREGYIIQDEYGNQRGGMVSNKNILENPRELYWVCINGVLSYSNKNDEVFPLYNADNSLTTCEIIFVNKENKPNQTTVD